MSFWNPACINRKSGVWLLKVVGQKMFKHLTAHLMAQLREPGNFSLWTLKKNKQKLVWDFICIIISIIIMSLSSKHKMHLHRLDWWSRNQRTVIHISENMYVCLIHVQQHKFDQTKGRGWDTSCCTSIFHLCGQERRQASQWILRVVIYL